MCEENLFKVSVLIYYNYLAFCWDFETFSLVIRIITLYVEFVHNILPNCNEFNTVGNLSLDTSITSSKSEAILPCTYFTNGFPEGLRVSGKLLTAISRRLRNFCVWTK